MHVILAALLLPAMVEETGALRVVNSEPNRDASVCVFSRIIHSELPYARSWIKHHESLGIQTFYLLTNHPDEYNTINGFLGGTSKDLARTPVLGSLLIRRQIKTNGSRATINLYTSEKGGADDQFKQDVSKQILAEITEDFVVGIDIDEYWVMPSGISTLVELIAADHNNADIHYATWMMIPNDVFDAQVPPYQVWQGKEHKWMARTNAIETFGCHEPNMKRTWKGTKKYDQGKLMHFWGRTFSDPLLKGMTGTGTGKGGEGPATTIQLLKNDLLPQRLKLLAFLVIHPVERQMSFEAPLMKVENNLEMQYTSLAFDTTLEQTQQILNKARQTYVNFKACLAQQEDLPKYPGGPNLIAIAGYLDKSPCSGKLSDDLLMVAAKDFGHSLASIDDLDRIIPPVL